MNKTTPPCPDNSDAEKARLDRKGAQAWDAAAAAIEEARYEDRGEAAFGREDEGASEGIR